MGKHRADWGGGVVRDDLRSECEGVMNRRAWLRTTVGAAATLGGVGPAFGAGQGNQAKKPDEADELRQAEVRARKATNRPLNTLKSAHYQAIGDASEAFIKLTVTGAA